MFRVLLTLQARLDALHTEGSLLAAPLVGTAPAVGIHHAIPRETLAEHVKLATLLSKMSS